MTPAHSLRDWDDLSPEEKIANYGKGYEIIYRGWSIWKDPHCDYPVAVQKCLSMSKEEADKIVARMNVEAKQRMKENTRKIGRYR